MTFAAKGSIIEATATTFTLVPNTVNDFILMEIICEGTTSGENATALKSSNVNSNSNWTVLTGPTLVASGGGTFYYSTMFIGEVTSTSSATATITISSGSPTVRGSGWEYSTSVGYSSVTLDTSGEMNTSTLDYASLTPGHGSGELYFGYAFNSGSGYTAGSTSGYTYENDANGNGLCYNASCTSSAQQPVWSGTAVDIAGISVLLYEASTGTTSTVAMGFNAAMAAAVTVANPVTSTVAMAFNPAMAVVASIPGPVSSTVAMGFSPSIAAAVTVANPVTATAALAFNPSMAASGLVPFVATAAMGFKPAMAASVSVIPPVTATVAMSFSPSIAATGATVAPSPLMTLAGEVTVDPFGNVVPAGLYVYGPDSSYTALVDNGVTSAIKFQPPSVTNVTTNPQVASFASNPGTSTEFEWLLMTSGKENSNSDAAIQLTSQNANNTGSPEIIFEFGGITETILTPGGGFSAGAWQTASLVNSWTSSSEGVNGFYYRLLPFGMLEIIADIINTTATGNSQCFTLPSGFIPGTGSMNFPAGWNNPATSNSASVPWVNITNTGVVQITGIESANHPIFFHILAPIVTV